jgi:hypothetical protein
MKSICSHALEMADYRVCNEKLIITQNEKLHTPPMTSKTHRLIDRVF